MIICSIIFLLNKTIPSISDVIIWLANLVSIDCSIPGSITYRVRTYPDEPVTFALFCFFFTCTLLGGFYKRNGQSFCFDKGILGLEIRLF